LLCGLPATARTARSAAGGAVAGGLFDVTHDRFLWFVDDGMSSMTALWSIALYLDSGLGRAAALDAATVSPVDRMVK
jgi:hypothetical protein